MGLTKWGDVASRFSIRHGHLTNVSGACWNRLADLCCGDDAVIARASRGSGRRGDWSHQQVFVRYRELVLGAPNVTRNQALIIDDTGSRTKGRHPVRVAR